MIDRMTPVGAHGMRPSRPAPATPHRAVRAKRARAHAVRPYVLLACLLSAIASPVVGQTYGPPSKTTGIVDPSEMPGPLKEVGIDQRLGEKLPLDAPFVDETGREVTLGDYFGERPVILFFGYYDCPMLCPLIWNGLAKSIGVLEFNAGTEFDVVSISIAPDETAEMAQNAKTKAVERYGRPETAGGWHFLRGSPESIRRATEAAGFRYALIEDSGEYAHASGIMVTTPDGTLAQYHYGIDYSPKDLRLALVEASENPIGSVVDQILLYCFRYDPTVGKYTAVVTRVLRLAGVAFLLALAAFLWIMWRLDRRRTPSLGTA